MLRPICVVAATALLGSVAQAQRGVVPPAERPPSPLPPALMIFADSTDPLMRSAAATTALRGGVMVYELTSMRAGQIAPLGTRRVEVTEAVVAGVPAWLIAEQRDGSVVPTSDSLFLSRADLAPLRWTASNGRAQMAASFTRDSVYGGLVGYQGRASFVAALAAGALVTPGMVERYVEQLPLQLGFRAPASLLMVEQGGARTVPAELAVEREERLATAAGERDCWIVTLRAGATEERFWVTKDDARVVKTEQATPTGLLTATLRP